MKPISSPQDQGWDAEIVDILRHLGSLKVEYPSELRAARRAAFLRQVEQAKNEGQANEQFLRYMESLKSINMEYPLALRAARREAFIAQIEQHNQVSVAEASNSEDHELIKLFKHLKSVEAEYPPQLMAARRAAFRRQLALGGRVSVLEALRAFLRNLSLDKIKSLSLPAMSMMRTSLVVAVLMLATIVGSLLRSPSQPASPSAAPDAVSQPGGIFAATKTGGVARIVCKPGYVPPLCLANTAEESQNLTFQGNGARPAVAKDALPGSGGVFKAAYANDGLYGRKASWVSQSADSWIKIDLGKTATINTIAFGKDRLGISKDGNPGQFVIAVALSDNVYADGNSSNDFVEYTEVYDSKQAGFDGIVSGSETILAHFGAVKAKYIKITFANPGTAVDEIQAFMMQSPVLANYPTRKPREDSPDDAPISVPTKVPTKAPTSVPTGTSVPTDVATSVPTATPVPVNTATPVPTNTPAPTDTPLPPPTSTPPPPTNTPLPPPTSTPLPPTSPPPTNLPPTNPPPTNPPPTDLPPTSPPPTSQPLAPTNQQPVADTSTPAPPANMIEPLSVPSDTPIPAQP
jgi:hypothetical protein